MKKKIKYFSIVGMLFLLTACDTQSGDITTDYSSVITEELMKDENSVYIEEIDWIEFVGENNRDYHGDFLEKSSKMITHEYNVHLTFKESVKSMSDIEIQALIEDLPVTDMTMEYSHSEDGIFTRTTYVYGIHEIYIELNDDQYIVSSKKITKNGLDYDPEYVYLKEQREIERNKRYDVFLKVLSERYSLRNVTKSEISNYYDEKYLELVRSLPSTVGSRKKNIPRLINWREDVEFIKEYE